MAEERKTSGKDGLNQEVVVKVDSDLADLVPNFLANRRADIRTIRQAAGDQDFDLIKRIGHVMKGAGAGYGFDGITELGALIEECAVARDEKGIRAAVERLADYLDHLRVIYE